MNRDIVVIGGSAGGVEAVLRLARHLPADLPASIFVVIHTPPHGNGDLAGLIARAGKLACTLAEEGDKIEAGRIYVARPDYHLLLEPGRIHLGRDPRGNRHRPAIDPLFRSAAASYGMRVIGVILSGNLDDGSSGMASIKRKGGLAIVQHPDDAAFPGMPISAMNAAKVDYAVPLDGVSGLLSKLCFQELEVAAEA